MENVTDREGGKDGEGGRERREIAETRRGIGGKERIHIERDREGEREEQVEKREETERDKEREREREREREGGREGGRERERETGREHRGKGTEIEKGEVEVDG